MDYKMIEMGGQAKLHCWLHEDSPEMPQMARRPAVLVLPGGGYEFTSDREADSVASVFYSKGYQAFVLRYSTKEAARGYQPLLEASRVLVMIRQKAAEWCVQPDKVAVCGFSAGGHLAGSTGILSQRPEVLEAVPCKAGENLPDAMVLVYPVVSSGEYAHRGSFFQLSGSLEDDAANEIYSLEKHVSAGTPPTFVWHAVDDDVVPVENTLMLLTALQRNKIPYEAHIFEKGGHGGSVCSSEVGSSNPHCAHWVQLCLEWLADRFDFAL